ncbi:unnamed protein product [Symbiodinium natans]|uniref:Uncharacterized protein n=1 Tax=Symbiodinium natans TaxID=878477 RepID=A0A812SSH6_9DINO|nr:unnamed protein product [Symbiodinium natans]
MLKKVAPTETACQFEHESEVCFMGWKKTTAFELPLDYFRNYSLQNRSQKSWNNPLDVIGQRNCTSMQPFQDSEGAEPFLLTLQLVSEMHVDEVSAVPFLLSEHGRVLKSDFACTQRKQRCELNVHHAAELVQAAWQARNLGNEMPMMGIVFLLPKECSLSVTDYWNFTLQEFDLQSGHQATICGYTHAPMAAAKFCGGDFETRAFKFPIEPRQKDCVGPRSFRRGQSYPKAVARSTPS